MHITRKLLLHLAHLIGYARAFNNTNAQLDEIQRRHFNDAGADILIVRDPFVDYRLSADAAREEICALCHVDSPSELFAELEQCNDTDELAIEDEDWLFTTMHDALTYYQERHLFFMLESEYEADLITHLGTQGKARFDADVHALLNKHLMCGNADSSIRMIKEFLIQHGHPYVDPPPPYREKYNQRFAVMHASIRASVQQTLSE